MCGHMEGQTVERHLNIFSILFSDKICRQFLEQHGIWVLFLCVFFLSFFFFLLYKVCSRSRGRLFSFFFFYYLFLFFSFSFQSVRGGRVKMNFFKILIIFYELPLLCLQCNVMSLSSLFLFISAMHFCCTFLFVRPFTCSAPVFTSLPRVSAGTHNHMHPQNAHCSGFGCFFCSVCWRLRVAAASSVGMKGRRREGARTASHFCCWRAAPPVTSLSWAPNPIVGVMAGNFVATSWLGEDPLPRVALWVIARSVCAVCWQRAVAVCLWLWD
ncbi:hypothetical protein ECC02_009197 [Trypanosoma cruzi]|uniref:Uncharacterized protein n=1 Tax=Trypanosoma cruzi TaxID=5693 RepID=A0A7J6XTY1_TRYCR|nr:hypothetical protein ECC02_009197 [Trypanosoma cruzi]